MQIFNVGLGELLFILVIVFIVLGPKKAVTIAGEAGGWIRNLVNSNFWQEIISTSREIQDLPKRLMEEAEIQTTIDDLDRSTDDLNAGMEKTSSQLQDRLYENKGEMQSSQHIQGGGNGE
jgi:Sec-independent protein translocase protein TatA